MLVGAGALATAYVVHAVETTAGTQLIGVELDCCLSARVDQGLKAVLQGSLVVENTTLPLVRC